MKEKHSRSSKPERSQTAPRVLEVGPAGAYRRAGETLRETNNPELDSGIMLSTLSKKCLQHLIKQMKSVYHYYVCEKKLWRQFLQRIETHQFGQRLPHAPTLTSCLAEALRTQADDTSALSAQKLPRKTAMRTYVEHWQRNKSFKLNRAGRIPVRRLSAANPTFMFPFRNVLT